jgi:hypothetical protein
LGVKLFEREVHLYSAHAAARILFAAAALYIGCASLVVWVAEGCQFRANNIYYLALVVLVAIAAAASLRRLEVGTSRLGGLMGVASVFSLGALAWMLYRYPHLYSGSLWIDEVTQFYGDQRLPRFVADPALFAAIQQQPPIDYYLSAFARIVFGPTEPAVLLHSVLFGALSFFLFLLWLIQIRFPATLAAIPIIVFAAHHSLLRFSSEARPISLGVFFSLTTLIFAHESVRRRRVHVIPLACSALLLLNSVGLQPLFFLLVLSFSLIPALALRFTKGESAKFLAALAGGPILFFFPTLWEIFRESRGQGQFFSGSPFEIIWASVGALGWHSFAPFFVTLKYLKWLLFLPAGLLLLIAIRPSAGSGRHRAEAAAWVIASAVFAFLFPILFRISWGVIDWYLHPYYVVLWVVGLIALNSQGLAYVWNTLLRPYAGSRYLAALFVGGIVGAGLLHVSFTVAHKEMIKRERSDRPDWRALVKKAQVLGGPVTIVEIPYGRFGWAPYHSMAGRFYESPEGIQIVRLEDWSRENLGVQRFDIGRAAKAAEGRTLWFLWSVNNPPGDSLSPGAEDRIYGAIGEVVEKPTHLANQVFLAGTKGKSPPAEIIATLFAKIVEADPGSDRNFYLADALTMNSIRRGDCKGANAWFQLMNESTLNLKPSAAPLEGLILRLKAVRQEVEGMACAKASSRAAPSRRQAH